MPNVKTLKSLTTLEAEKQSKKIAGELNEQLETLGQESESKAVKWVQEVGKEEDHDEQEKQAEHMQRAHDVKGKIFTYRDAIINYMKKEMVDSREFVPYDFLWYPVKDSGQNIILYIRDPKNKWYGRGVKLCHEPKYDINCAYRVIVKALDFMEKKNTEYEQEKKIVV